MDLSYPSVAQPPLPFARYPNVASMKLPPSVTSTSRRAVVAQLMGTAALVLSPLRTPAEELSVPTFSLKGAPVFGSLFEAPPPTAELGVIGRGKDNSRSGILNFCDKKGCISSFSAGDAENYIPPLTYQPGYNAGAASSFSSPLKQQLAEEAAKKPGKPRETAFQELLDAVKATPEATVIKSEDRYIYAEYKDGLTGAVDDVEFLFSLDLPIVGYRSAPRRGDDDTRQRRRLRDLRKSLEVSGWKSVGRIVS